MMGMRSSRGNEIMTQKNSSEFVPPPEEIVQILRNSKVVAIVGLSDNRRRPSNRVGKYLKLRGYKIIPVNPRHEEILDLKSYANLLDIPDEIDIVDIFRKPETVGEVIDEALRKGVKVIWMQEGVVNETAARKAKDAGITVVMDRCMYKEYKKHSKQL
jgi:predicted CoA-binding protein